MLIFASVAERYAEIVADAGIHAKVPQDVWDGAIAAMIAAIRDGRPADGFVAAIDAMRGGAGAAFPAGRAQPRRIAEQAGGNLVSH